ncbi:MAG: peptidoglycan-binding protein [Clostridia bacterium]|nr:peptidoglycan-binding protein [Clostridia bacterium]
MAGHVGVYVGDGEVVEWRGFSYGCVSTRLEERRWLHWYRLPWTEYVTGSAGGVQEEALLLGGRLLGRGMKGADVRELQEELVSLGYPLEKCGADGEFGRETEQALRAFQKAAGIRADGLYGPASHASLMQVRADMAAQAGEDEAEEPEKTGRIVVVTGGRVNLREGAGTQYGVASVVRRGMELEWVATAGNGWHAVRAGETLHPFLPEALFAGRDPHRSRAEESERRSEGICLHRSMLS